MKTIGYAKNSLITRRPRKEIRERFESSFERLVEGREYRQQSREEAWRNSYDQYMNRMGWENTEDPTADSLSINISFSTINTILPLVADESPTFMVEPYSADSDATSATVIQAFLNRLWTSDEVNGQVHLRDATFDYLVYGDGYLSVNYEIKPVVAYSTDGEEISHEGNDMAEFTVARINPWDVWIDPSSDGVYNARWVCVRKMFTPDELNDDSRYKLLDKVESGSTSPYGEEEGYEAQYSGFIAVYHFYDMKDRYMVAFMDDNKLPIRYVEHIDPPVVQISNYRVPNSPYHMGELEQVVSLQHEINRNRSEMITHRRRNVLKWAVRESLLSQEAIDALRSGRVGDIVGIEVDAPIGEVIQALDPQPLSPDNYMLDDIIRSDFNELTGVNEYLRGNVMGSSRSATESAIIEGATNLRTRHKLHQIETSAAKLGQLLLDIIGDVLPTTQFEEMRQYIRGREADKINRAAQQPTNTDVLITPLPEYFQGKYVVFVERGSVELRDPQIRATKYKEMFNVVASSTPILMQAGVFVNLKKILELWFDAEGVEDVDALFEPDEDQDLAREMAMAQQAGLLPAQGNGQGPPGNGEGPVGGAPTMPGQPRPETTGPPEEMIDPSNSGMLSAMPPAV